MFNLTITWALQENINHKPYCRLEKEQTHDVRMYCLPEAGPSNHLGRGGFPSSSRSAPYQSPAAGSVSSTSLLLPSIAVAPEQCIASSRSFRKFWAAQHSPYTTALLFLSKNCQVWLQCSWTLIASQLINCCNWHACVDSAV